MPIVPENKALCFICILCVSLFLFLITKIKISLFYLRPLWSKYPPYFFIFCNLERICLYNREIILAALLRQNGKTNMTKNRDISKKKLFLPSTFATLTVRITL